MTFLPVILLLMFNGLSVRGSFLSVSWPCICELDLIRQKCSTDVMKQDVAKWDHGLSGLVFSPVAGVPLGDIQTERQIQEQKHVWRQKQGLELGSHKLSNSLASMRRCKRLWVFHELRVSSALLTPWAWIFGLKKHEVISSCCFRPPSLL